MDMLNKEAKENLNQIIHFITNKKEYQNCLKIKEKMNKSKKVKDLVDEIKKLQKKYIKEKEDKIKETLDQKIRELQQIPIYQEYQNNLEVINEIINYVKDDLNDYFYQVLNNKKIGE